MKVFISIFLILSHLFSTVGFNMEVHECGEEKSYTFFGFSLSSLCECNHESEHHDHGCCKDKKTVVKAEHNDKQTIKVFVSKQLIQNIDLPNPKVFLDSVLCLNSCCSSPLGIEHPPNHSPPLYILNNVFLI